MPADPHKPLRDDVRLLGQLLGETLRTHVGQDIFETVETVRAMAKSAREGDEADFARLKQTLGALPVDHALPVARAFAHFLHLANIAEQHHRVRRRRAYQRDSNALPQRDSCDEAFAALLDAGLRAIPWVFGWTQMRLIVPTWLGVGQAFEQVMQDGGEALLQEMYQDWPMFQATLDLIEMVLAKAEPRIASQYDQHLAQPAVRDIGQTLRQALAQTIVAVRRVTRHQALLQNNPVLLRSINVRNPYVDPLNLVQVELLRQLRHAGDDAQLHDALLVTINGIAAGMRNTG